VFCSGGRANCLLFFLHRYIIASLEIVPMLYAKARVNILLWEHFNGENVVATLQAAFELNFNSLAITVPEKHIAHLKIIQSFFWLLPSFYIPVQLAILGYRVSPKFTAATGLLAFFELYALLLFIFG